METTDYDMECITINFFDLGCVCLFHKKDKYTHTVKLTE